MKLLQQQRVALSAPARPLAHCQRSQAALVRPRQPAPGPRTPCSAARHVTARRQAPARCALRLAAAVALSYCHCRQPLPPASGTALLPAPVALLPCMCWPPAQLAMQKPCLLTPAYRDASAMRCRFLRGAGGPLGRPWIAVAACRHGSKLIVSATLVSRCCAYHLAVFEEDPGAQAALGC